MKEREREIERERERERDGERKTERGRWIDRQSWLNLERRHLQISFSDVKSNVIY